MEAGRCRVEEISWLPFASVQYSSLQRSPNPVLSGRPELDPKTNEVLITNSTTDHVVLQNYGWLFVIC